MSEIFKLLPWFYGFENLQTLEAPHGQDYWDMDQEVFTWRQFSSLEWSRIASVCSKVKWLVSSTSDAAQSEHRRRVASYTQHSVQQREDTVTHCKIYMSRNIYWKNKSDITYTKYKLFF